MSSQRQEDLAPPPYTSATGNNNDPYPSAQLTDLGQNDPPPSYSTVLELPAYDQLSVQPPKYDEQIRPFNQRPYQPHVVIQPASCTTPSNIRQCKKGARLAHTLIVLAVLLIISGGSKGVFNISVYYVGMWSGILFVFAGNLSHFAFTKRTSVYMTISYVCNALAIIVAPIAFGLATGTFLKVLKSDLSIFWKINCVLDNITYLIIFCVVVATAFVLKKVNPDYLPRDGSTHPV